MSLKSPNLQRLPGSQMASQDPLGARASKAVVTVLLLSVWIALLSASPASAQSLDRYRTFLGQYDYTATGNTLRTSDVRNNPAIAGEGTCAVGNASSADITVPTGATISAAYLYWAGSYDSGAGGTVDDQVTFDGQVRTADRTFTSTFTFNGTDYDFFSGFEDVTTQIQAKGTGTHTLAFSDLTVNTGSPHCDVSGVMAGWALFVVFQDPTDTETRKINIYDGFLTSRGVEETVTLKYISVPSTPNGRFSYLLWEGDAGGANTLNAISEGIQFNGNSLSGGNPNSPVDDPFNSTNTFTNNNASYGLDLDEFDVASFLSAGDQTATATVSAGSDLVFTNVMIVEVDTDPDGDTDGDTTTDIAEDTDGNGDPFDDDFDGDGVPNFLDIDSDNDGITDAVEIGPDPSNPLDTDTDGTPDYLDLDSDGDTVVDLIDGNDADKDGVSDHVGNPPGSAAAVADVDGDGRIDLTGTGAFTDANGNGLDDRYEPSLSGRTAAEQNTDGTDGSDRIDNDDDGDGILTATETGDTTPANGTPDYLEADASVVPLTINLVSTTAGTLAPGEEITYTTTITNNSSVTQTGITASSVLPSDLAYVANSSSVTAPASERFVDAFKAQNYSGTTDSDGTAGSAWSGNWAEVGETTNATAGNVQVVTDGSFDPYAAQITGGSGFGLERTVDLTGYSDAKLSFNLRRDALQAGDQLDVQVQAAGGSFVTVGSIGFTGSGKDAAYETFGIDLNNTYVSNATTIRFVSNTLGAGRSFFVDDVEVFGVGGAGQTSAAGTPSAFVTEQALRPGDAMTITYKAKVNDTPTSSSYTTTASSISNQMESSVSDSATDEIADADGDGIPDAIEDTNGDNDPSNDDADGDGIANYLDLDSDNDGVTDEVEAGASGFDPVNTDSGTGDTTPDYLDLDSDGDTVQDYIDGNDANKDGVSDHAGAPYNVVYTAGRIDATDFTDTNGNGLDDRYEPALSGRAAAEQDTDFTDGSDRVDNDDDGDFILTVNELGDTSPTNGTPDYLEAATLPVELTAFEAVSSGGSVELVWQTASEKDNAGFQVEMRSADELAFNVLSFVEGQGSTTEAASYRYRTSDLDPGQYTFRLRQLDRDGTASYSAEVEATVEMAEAFVLEQAYPNPFNPSATVRFAVREAQKVRVELYDMLGRRVQVLFDGAPAAGQMQSVRIDGSRLASGTYVVRLVGRSFSRAHTVTLVK